MFAEKLPEHRRDVLAGIFKHVMPRLLKCRGFRLGESPLKFFEKSRREAPIPHPPNEVHRRVLELAEALFHFGQCAIGRMRGLRGMSCTNRNVAMRLAQESYGAR